MDIVYKTDLENVTPKMLEGFCVGWANPLSGSELHQVLKNSYRIVLALKENQVVGFANSLSDKVKFAFIPMIEVLPKYQNMGIGKKIIETMLAQLKGIDNIDLMCDKNMQSYYEKFGMLKAHGMVIRKHLMNS